MKCDTGLTWVNRGMEIDKYKRIIELKKQSI